MSPYGNPVEMLDKADKSKFPYIELTAVKCVTSWLIINTIWMKVADPK